MNQNIHKISADICDEGPKITSFMCEGDRIGDGTTNERRKSEKWVRKST
jgi:hypothetical protein